MYSDSKIAAKQSTARTKATAIVNNILAPHSVSEIKKKLQGVSYYGIGTDASNHKAEKCFLYKFNISLNTMVYNRSY